MPFPIHRMRRLRKSRGLRSLVRETELAARNLVLPLFVCPGKGVSMPISSLPGHSHMSADVLVEQCREAEALGVGGVILFGIPDSNDPVGSGAYAEVGVGPQAGRAIKGAGVSGPGVTGVGLCR